MFFWVRGAPIAVFDFHFDESISYLSGAYYTVRANPAGAPSHLRSLADDALDTFNTFTGFRYVGAPNAPLGTLDAGTGDDLTVVADITAAAMAGTNARTWAGPALCNAGDEALVWAALEVQLDGAGDATRRVALYTTPDYLDYPGSDILDAYTLVASVSVTATSVVLRLRRESGTITASYSEDGGGSWSTIGTTTFVIDAQYAQVGFIGKLAAASDSMSPADWRCDRIRGFLP